MTLSLSVAADFIYPEAFQRYSEHIPEEERNDYLAAYYKRVTSDDPEVQKKAALEWTLWEGACSRLVNSKEFVSKYEEEKFALAFARIETHYFFHGAFFPSDDYLVRKENIDKIRHIPTVIVQGRYDIGKWFYLIFKSHIQRILTTVCLFFSLSH